MRTYKRTHARLSACMAWGGEGKGQFPPRRAYPCAQSHRILIANIVCFPNPGYDSIRIRINKTVYSPPRQQHLLATRRGAGLSGPCDSAPQA